MERMRLQTLYLVNVQLDKKKQFKTAKSLMAFDWDHKEVSHIAPQPTEAEYKQMDKITAGGKR